MALSVGQTIGPYKLEQQLGRGGMATVFRAFQASVKRYVAIKVMSPEIANEPGFVERFNREAEVIGALQHPHILPIIDYGEADSFHYIVMRYMDGGSLDERMNSGALDYPTIQDYLSQMSSALDFAHRRGVIHRDLKPNNVLLDNEGNLYLTDYGIARIEQSDRKLTTTGTVMGTPAYMAPEQAMGQPVDARSDIYSLGVILYEMTLGQLPFSADTPAALIFQHVYEQPKPPRSVKPDLPEPIVNVLLRALSKNPDMRYQSAGELARAFRTAVESAPLPLTPSDPNDYNPTVQISTPSGGLPRPNRSDYTPTVPPTGVQGDKARTPTPILPPVESHPRTLVQTGSIAAVAPPAKRERGIATSLIVGAVAAAMLVGIGGGGAYLVLTERNNADATATRDAIAIAQVATDSQATNEAILASSFTATLTETPTATTTFTATSTETATPTVTSTDTLTPSDTLTSTITETPTPTSTTTPIPTDTATQTAIPSATFTQTATFTGTPDVTATSDRATALAGIVLTGTARSARSTALAGTRAVAATLVQLTVTYRPTETPVPTRTRVSTLPPSPTPTAVTGLLGLNSSRVLPSLIAANVIAAGDTVTAVTLDSALRSYSLQVTSDGSYQVVDIGPQIFTDFIISSDIRIFTNNDPLNLADASCGLFTWADIDDTSNAVAQMNAFALTRKGIVYSDPLRGAKWNERLFQQQSSIINTELDAPNRLTIVKRGRNVTVFVNGVSVYTLRVTGSLSGQLGYFAQVIKTNTETYCTYQNTLVWRLDT